MSFYYFKVCNNQILLAIKNNPAQTTKGKDVQQKQDGKHQDRNRQGHHQETKKNIRKRNRNKAQGHDIDNDKIYRQFTFSLSL